MSETVGQCERCDTPIERGDLRCSICASTVPAGSTATSKARVTVQVLRCAGCGAAISYDPDHQAPACSFCASVLEIETLEDPPEQTEGWLPFTVSQSEARHSLQRWLGSLGWFRPDDLRSESRLESLRPLLWVGWVFDAHARVSWAGDSNAGSRRSAWAPHSGQSEMIFDDVLVSASRGLTDEEVDALAPSYDLATRRSEPADNEDATIERFDVQRSQARNRVIDAVHDYSLARADEEIPGTRSRKLKVAVLLRSLDTRRLSFPAWVLAYRYDGRLFRAVISGQDASTLHGSAPYSLAKILLVVAAALAVVAGIVLTMAS